MSKNIYLFVRRNRLFSRLITGFVVLFLSIAWFLPVLGGMADAVQLTSRSLNISSGQSAATGVTYTYTFTPSATAISSVKFVECTTAIGTYGFASTSSTTGCTAPNGCSGGNCINQGTGGGFTVGNGWTNTTTPTRQITTLNNCAPGNNVLCITRTAGSAETAVSHTFTWNTQTNPTLPSGNGYTFYIGIYTYSDASFATPVDSGTVASAVVQSLTINAAVAEILNFCVGSTSVNDATTQTYTGCAAMAGTSVNLGTLDAGHINVTPVSTNCSAADCSKNGVAMLQSNAINGSSVYYDAIQQSGTNHVGTLRIAGATCTNDTVNGSTDQTDSCFDETNSKINFVAGTEDYGMAVAAINCGTVAAYTCTYSTGAYNLQRTTNYNSTGANTYTTDTNQVTGTSNGKYAWDETGTAVQLATSSSSTIKQVDNEALILKFAATPAITTPFGVYTAKADFIAVSTY